MWLTLLLCLCGQNRAAITVCVLFQLGYAFAVVWISLDIVRKGQRRLAERRLCPVPCLCDLCFYVMRASALSPLRLRLLPAAIRA